MIAHRYVWLTRDGQEFGEDDEATGLRCASHTFYDLILSGASPTTVARPGAADSAWRLCVWKW